MSAEERSADFRGKLGRYALYGEIAAGGMATVHLARLLGPVGFARTVAIKRLHPHLAKDPDFTNMFLEEARLAARVRHPNVVATLDVVSDEGELFLVMEYIAGESLSRLVRKAREAGRPVPPRYVAGLVCGTLDGLHAAHEAKSERGEPLGIVHRDVSPQNVHVGVDGVPRVLDFGIAKATNRVQETRTDQIKGKVAYMSPEQLAKGNIDRRADVYSASVVLWEALTGQRLFKADDVPTLVYAIINDEVRKPSELVDGLPRGLDEIVMRGLSRDANDRYASALEMAEALEKVIAPAPQREIGGWVVETAGDALAWRTELVHRIESATSSSIPPPMRLDSPSSPIEVTSGVRRTGDDLGDSARDVGEVEETGTLDAQDALEEPHGRSWVGIGAIAMAAILVLLVGGFFGLRWLQMTGEASSSAADPAPTMMPRDQAEPAIAIGGALRSASAQAPSTAPPPVNQTSTAIRIAKPPPPAATAPNDCDNPFTVDARGIRHPKPHCFKRP